MIHYYFNRLIKEALDDIYHVQYYAQKYQDSVKSYRSIENEKSMRKER